MTRDRLSDPPPGAAVHGGTKPVAQTRGAAGQPASNRLNAAQPDDPTAGLRLILQIERDARRASAIGDLQFLIVNETRRLIGARQVFLFANHATGATLSAVSSLSSIDRAAPVSVWLESVAAALLEQSADGATKPVAVDLRLLRPDPDAGDRFPFNQGLAMRLVDPSGRLLGLALAVRETAFSETDALALQRVGETFAHAWAALGGRPASWTRFVRQRSVWLAIALAIMALGFLRVPLTALASAEVAPLEPIIIAAPIDGAIEEVAVAPNAAVKAGDVLLRYADTQARGALDVAEREVAVAQARLRQAQQMAFVDPQAKRDLAVAQNDLRLKQAERAYAQDVFQRTIVRAPKDGVAVFADKRELIGRPVSTGQRLMEIADPARRQFRFQVPADDAVILVDGAHARIFMDSDPLRPIGATVARVAPMAKVSESGALTFRADAFADDGETTPPLGHRGAAQISGKTVSLAFFLFRRPIAALRQKTGL